MNLLDAYVTEVGKHLSRKNRADITAEIRSTLDDMIEERNHGKSPADDQLVMDLLKEYGSPKKIASTYRTNQYLIGPRLFPVFEIVTRIVLIVLVSVSLAGLGVSLAKTGLTSLEVLSRAGKWFSGLFGAVTAAVGNIVIVFAVIERTRAAKEFELEYQQEIDDWNPSELTVAPDPSKTYISESIVTIIFTFLFLVILNVYPEAIAVYNNRDGVWTSMPFLTEKFFRFAAWINIMGALQVCFNSFMLSQKKWKPGTRALGLATDIAGAALAVVILSTPGIFSISAKAWNLTGIPEAGKIVAQLFLYIPRIIIAAVILGTVVKTAKTVIAIVKDKMK